MENTSDLELTDELQIPEVHEAFFQFNDDEPVRFAFVAGGEFSLTLRAVETNTPSVTFTDGKGKEFKIFLKVSEDGVQ
jgi:hypothetical protein